MGLATVSILHLGELRLRERRPGHLPRSTRPTAGRSLGPWCVCVCVFPLLGWEPWGQGPDPILLWVWRLLWAVSGPVQRQVGNFSLGLRLGAFPPCEALSSPCQGGRHFSPLVWGPAPQYLTPRRLFVSLIYLVHSLTAWNRPLHLGNVGILSGKALAAALCAESLSEFSALHPLDASSTPPPGL